MGAAKAVQGPGTGLAVEVDQRLDQADPRRDLGVRPCAELLADGSDDDFGFVVLALAGQLDAALRSESGRFDRVVRRGDACSQLGEQA
jgi:hypothetical protein